MIATTGYLILFCVSNYCIVLFSGIATPKTRGKDILEDIELKMTDELITGSSLESPICSPSPEDDHCCPACQEKLKQPKILSCLHVFCEPCLQKQVGLQQGFTLASAI